MTITKRRAKIVVAPKQSKSKQPKPSTINQLALLLKSVTEIYPNDPTIPGVTISWLHNRNQFYGAIRRYKVPYGQQGYNVICTHSDTFEEVIIFLVTEWIRINTPKTSATEELISRS